MTPSVFRNVGVPKVQKSVFNLTHERLLTGSFGYLYPSMLIDCVPGDVFSIAKRITCRLRPLVYPIMSEVNMFEHTFFVPYRLLMRSSGESGGGNTFSDAADFEDMLIGGDNTVAIPGDEAYTIPTRSVGAHSIGDLSDYLGFPPIGGAATGALPVAFPFRAYSFIWNEFYRDIDLDTELDITATNGLQTRRWEKDYFTSAREWQQRGTSPAVPLTGTLDVEPNGTGVYPTWETSSESSIAIQGQGSNVPQYNKSVSAEFLDWEDPNLQVDLSNGVTVDMADFRLLMQTQRWMERNARAGTRYNEVLKSHFGYTGFNDARAQRPIYIGGIKSPIVISEVLKTSEEASADSTAPLGAYAGHGITVGNGFIGKFRVPEYGIIMSILSIMPRSGYSQGIDRQWRKDSLYDFYWPEFANLSEQAILTSEIYATTVEATNDTVFGYQGRYNHMRIMQNQVCGEFRPGGDFDDAHLYREFASQPSLNANFVKSRYTGTFQGGIRDEVFAVTSEDTCWFRVGNIIKAVRPLPVLANPGYVDHN